MTAPSTQNTFYHFFQYFFIILLGTLFSINISYAATDGEIPRSPKISINSAIVTEGDVAKINISIDNCPTTSSIILNYWTKDGSAKQPNDYTNKKGSITFIKTNCKQSINISIPTKDDSDVEGTESFTLSFKVSSEQSVEHIPTSTSVTIYDNDKPPKQPQLAVNINKQAKNSQGDWENYEARGLTLNDDIIYRIAATNTGDPSTLKIEDTLPQGLTIKDYTFEGTVPSNFKCGIDPSKKTLTCGGKGTHKFKQHEQVIILLTVKANKISKYTNIATVTSDNPNISDSDWVDTYIGTQDIISSYDKTVSPAPNGVYLQEDNVTFTLSATNGNVAAHKIIVEDNLDETLADSFEYLGYSSSTMDCDFADQKLKCTSKTPIPVKGTITISIKAKLKKSGEHICNKAWFYGKETKSNIYIGSATACINVKEKNILQPNNDDYTVKRGETLSKNILDNDSGEGREVSKLVYDSSSTLPDNILKWQPDGAISYSASDTDGTLIYTYTAKDEYGTTSTAIVTIHVITPKIIAKNDTFNVTRNIPYTGDVFSDNGNGIDSGENISITTHTEPTHGKLMLNDNGEFTYTPVTAYTGNDTFSYTIKDSYGQEATATVSIIVGILLSKSVADFDLINPPDTRNIVGNYVATGNTVTCLTDQDGISGSADYNAACSTNKDINNNNKLVRYVDIDGDSTTWNSSSAEITLPSSYDEDNAGVLWAGLFWQGAVNHHSEVKGNKYAQRRAKTSGSSYIFDTFNGTNGTVNLNNTDVSKVKLKIDKSTYSTIVADTFYYNMIENNSISTYAAFSNVTALFKNAQLKKGDHTITLANLTANEGRELSFGNYGGWSLVVIYKEDDDDASAKARNISIYNGFVAIGPGEEETKEVHIAGFKLPKEGDVNANITTFVGEGEAKYGGRPEAYDSMYIIHDGAQKPMDKSASSAATHNIFDAKLTGVTRKSENLDNILDNTNGIDIDNYDVSPILKEIRDAEQNASALDIQIISKNTNNGYSSDYITPSMIAFSAELFVPNLCYNYTLDVDGFVIDSTHNQIITPALFSTKKPLTTHISILSKEGDFALKDTNITYSIKDHSQLHYIPNSVGIAKNEISTYQPAGDTGLKQAYAQTDKGFGLYIGDNVGQSPNSGKGGGTIDSHQMRYIRFDDEIVNGELNTSFSLKLKYLINYGSGPLELTKHFNQNSLCPLPAGYRTIRGRFNVTSEYADDKTGKPFNLHTQVANRPFNIKVFSHDDNLTALKRSDLTVEVEPFNANYYSHDAEISCQDVDTSIINTTDFVDFDGEDHVDISNINYNFAMRNIGFRVWYLVDDKKLYVKHQCTSANDNSCFKTLYSDVYSSTDTQCQTKCTSGTGCYMCLRKYYGRASCSQDNFSIRPNAFVSLIKDSNQSNKVLGTQTNNISHSRTRPSSTLGLSPDASIIAGYTYRFDINATNFIDDKATQRYIGLFDESYNNTRYVQFKWDSNLSSSNCANTDDINMTLPLMGGTSVIQSLDYAYTQSINHLGEYELRIFDQNWTAVDWAETSHHLKNDEWNTQIVDCKKDDTITLDIPVNNTSKKKERNGCAISNIHADSTNTYVAPKLHSYPYSFDLSGLTIGAGPKNNKNYVFMDTLSRNDRHDYDMSYNINGILKAKAYPNGSLENFTDSCYAADINMSLGTQYNSTVPIGENININFHYKLIDYKKDKSKIQNTDSSFSGSYRKDVERPVTVIQPKSIFIAEMNGSIDMNLGYNFDRRMDTPINPRAIHFSDFNVTYRTPPAKLYFKYRNDYKVEAQRNIDQNVTFVYGRVKPTQNFYDSVTENSIGTPLSITAYCDDITTVCRNDYRVGVIADDNSSARSNEAFWWFVQSHNQAEGRVVLESPINQANVINIAPNPPQFINGIANILSVAYRGTNRPYIATINLVTKEALPAFTHRWLIYNANANRVPNPFYRVRFINTAGWTGEGQTGHVVGDDINQKKNRKMEW